MNRLLELRKSMLDMEPDELRDLVRKIRVERRIVKDKPAAKAKRVKVSEKKRTSVESAISKMSLKEMEELMKMLGEES